MDSIKRYALLTLGFISLALGLVGLFLPVVPTTPFLLLAAACFLRSSRRLHEWMTGHPTFGCYIRDYEEGRGAPMRAKLIGVVTLWASIAASVTLMYFRIGPGRVWSSIAIAMGLVAVGVTWYLLAVLPTAPDGRKCSSREQRET